LPWDEAGFQPLTGVPLAPLTTLGVGGPARWYLQVAEPDQVAVAHAWGAAQGVPLLVLGGGSNVVIADEGFDGLVVQMALRGVTFERSGGDTIVTAAAGEPWDPFVEATVARGLAGLECLSGIPGSVGGTPIQNVGAYGQEVASAIEGVAVYDRVTREETTLAGPECGFAYRTSRFRHAEAGRFIVCSVRFRLRPGPATARYPDVRDCLRAAGVPEPTLAQVREAVIDVRRRKGMVLDELDPETRSVGSFFTNPAVTDAEGERIASVAGVPPPRFAADGGRWKVPAAWLIEQSGFGRGWTDGAVGVSRRHPLALVNRGGARARDIVRVASRIAHAVEDRFGVRLRAEPVFVGFGDDPEVARLSGAEGPRDPSAAGGPHP
jgi:UDP-N-acetylmuramate dehydrogenase